MNQKIYNYKIEKIVHNSEKVEQKATITFRRRKVVKNGDRKIMERELGSGILKSGRLRRVRLGSGRLGGVED